MDWKPNAHKHWYATGRLIKNHTVVVLEDLVAQRDAPEHLRSDNRPELVSWTLRDWCHDSSVTSTYMEPGAPWQNPYVESFNGHVRDELLNLEAFDSLLEARVLIADLRREYNHYRPHQSLGHTTPAAFARQRQHQHDHEAS